LTAAFKLKERTECLKAASGGDFVCLAMAVRLTGPVDATGATKVVEVVRRLMLVDELPGMAPQLHIVDL
jgi:hypothetical protein